MPNRRRFLALLATACAASLAAPRRARAGEKLTVLLDWFVNPDHAPLLAAQYIGAYQEAGLDVSFIAPADPSLPPRQIAAGQGDLALCYQPQLYLFADQGLPVLRVGTLIDMPLNCLVALKASGIKSLADLKGRKIGYSVGGVDEALIGAMLGSAGLTLADVTMVNVNFQLVTALMSRQVDAVIGAYRNFEVNELKEKHQDPVVFYPEDHGVPMTDELLLIANRNRRDDPRLPRFLNAVQKGVIYLLDHPQEMWERFAKEHPDLDNTLNRTAWFETLPRFAKNPFLLDAHRYDVFADFMLAHHLIRSKPKLADYAVQLPE